MTAQSSAQKVALVTGGSRGIGAAIAQRLAKDGFVVIINYVRSADEAQALISKIEQAGGRAIAAQADVSDAASVRTLFDSAEQAFGGIDVLVNNAGIMTLALLVDTDDNAFDKLMDINLKGTFNTLREAGKRLRSGGRVINFSSSVVGLYQPSYSIYAATKAAVEAMSKVFTNEMRGRNITVNVIAPGPTATDLFLDGKSPQRVEHIARLAPLERLGEPQDIAATVAFLAGPDGAWVNGQILRVNGGIV